MEEYPKTQNGLNKVTNTNITDIDPLAENFEIIDNIIGPISDVNLDGYIVDKDGQKNLSNLIKYVFKSAKETTIKLSNWSNQSLKDVLDWLKGRVTDTVKPNLSVNTSPIWLAFPIDNPTGKEILLDLPFTIYNEWLTLGEKHTIVFDTMWKDVTRFDLSQGYNYFFYGIGDKTGATATMANTFYYANGFDLTRSTGSQFNNKHTFTVTETVKNSNAYISPKIYLKNFKSGTLYVKSWRVVRGEEITPFTQATVDFDTVKKDLATAKTDISNLKIADNGLSNDIAGLQTSRYNLINNGNVPIVNSQNYPAAIYTLDDNTLKDNEKITIFIYGSILSDQRFYMCNTVGDTLIASIPSGGTSEKKLYIAKSTWKVKDTNNKLLVYPYLNKTTANNTNIDWIVLVRGHIDGLTEWIPSKSDVINMQLNTDVANLKSAEILDRQDIVKLNEAITGEDALIDANNVKFAQLLGVDISTIKGGIV
ncbi:hypothetical protein [Peptostreptococcus equinus]|uniref:Uncharacterized protein n=1 Tax=Peptostreptococcus equinus TaxID=3003601 RepID=A0ABY7JMZ4_9FIRM|nr:hypothetical protein [Peptostreptococcus sp. CBA3647]WAW14739.1 hypothetical protein O0R46_09160 [Peptostreptococcus sp. CBA3647]